MKTDKKQNNWRRHLTALLATALGAFTLVASGAETNASPGSVAANSQPPEDSNKTEPFWGKHQGGILTPEQRYSYFVAFDLATTNRDDVVKLLKAWTAAAARLTAGESAQPMENGLQPAVAPATGTSNSDDSYTTPDPSTTAADSGEAIDMAPSRLTLTFGFGAGLFVKDGKDRFGLASRRPAALVDLPKFAGDQLVEAHTGGDLSVQSCADDPQVAFHAIRQLVRIAGEAAQIRWVQTGFMPGYRPGQTPRNLMGFKDGTDNPSPRNPKAMDGVVWVGDEGPDWMRGGSYLVVRRIRIALEHWDQMKTSFQEDTVGRRKMSGAPLGGTNEFEPLNLNATNKDGDYVISENSHVRLAAPESNDGAQILRRPYSYDDGVNFTAERWPPWRQGQQYDAGLFFVAYQRDPRTGFIKIFEKMSKLDMMNQFVTHVGGGLFACPHGAKPGEFIGQELFAGQ